MLARKDLPHSWKSEIARSLWISATFLLVCGVLVLGGKLCFAQKTGSSAKPPPQPTQPVQAALPAPTLDARIGEMVDLRLATARCALAEAWPNQVTYFSTFASVFGALVSIFVLAVSVVRVEGIRKDMEAVKTRVSTFAARTSRYLEQVRAYASEAADHDKKIAQSMASAEGNLLASTELLKQLASAVEEGNTKNERLAAIIWDAETLLKETEKRTLVLRDIAKLRSTETVERVKAAQNLGEWQDSVAIQFLRDAVADDEASVRIEAIQALGRLNATQALGEIAQRSDDADPDVRQCAVRVSEMLQKLQGPNDDGDDT